MDDALVLKKRGYTLGIRLGEGSYAKVKSAYSDRLKSNVAVKIINRRKAPVDFLERFLPRELEILAVLNNRYIVKTYEIFETSDGKVYMIMELGVQGDLLEFIKFRGALPEEVCRKMFRQLSLAVKYIHDLEIVHRDLKCENLLLDKDFNLKVSDFGFSRRCNYDDDGQLGLSKTFCGSAAYAAPEVLQGIPYNAKVYDIWSMGVVLYIMLCGSMPYDDSNVKKMLRVQKEHRVDFPRGKHVPADCKDLLYRMLQPDVSKRIEIDDILDHPWLQPSKQKKDCESCSKSSSKSDTKGETKADSRNESRRGLRADADDEFDSEVLDEGKAEKKGFKSHCTEPTPTRAAGNRRKSSQKVKETIEEGD